MTEKPILKKPVSRTIEITAASSPPSLTPTSTAVSLSQTTNPRDLDRQRADIAWQNIQAVKTQKYKGKYGTLARKMPTLIQTNGLAQTLAFLKSKGKGQEDNHHTTACNHISNWFCTRFNWKNNTDLLNQILNMDSQTYRLATSEALSFLQWLKRFAEAELPSEDDNL
jgi:CRISPR-associated protein Cmr5